MSNIDGREPLASKLRNKFVDAKLTEDELDKLIKQFANFAKVRSRSFTTVYLVEGWETCIKQDLTVANLSIKN